MLCRKSNSLGLPRPNHGACVREQGPEKERNVPKVTQQSGGQRGTRIQIVKVLLGPFVQPRSRILPALVHVQRETLPDTHWGALMAQE